jgi:hypothetical protein
LNRRREQHQWGRNSRGRKFLMKFRGFHT